MIERKMIDAKVFGFPFENQSVMIERNHQNWLTTQKENRIEGTVDRNRRHGSLRERRTQVFRSMNKWCLEKHEKLVECSVDERVAE